MRQWALNIEYWMITERRLTRHVMDHVITGMETVLGSLLSPKFSAQSTKASWLLSSYSDDEHPVHWAKRYLSACCCSSLILPGHMKNRRYFRGQASTCCRYLRGSSSLFATWTILALSRPSTLGYDLWSDLSFPLCVENARCRSISCPNLDLPPLVD